MTAFFIATASIKNQDKFKLYAQKAGATFPPHGGELVLRGKVEGTLSGQSAHQAVGIIKFPNMKALQAWFNSDAYQAIIPLRDEAAEMTIVSYTVPA